MTGKLSHELTLAQAADLLFYGASCEACRETRRVDLAKVRDQLGPHVLVRDVRERLRCAKCGGRKVIAVTLWQSDTSAAATIGAWK